LVLNYLNVLNVIRLRGSQGKEKGVIRADIHISILVQMMKEKMYQIHVQLVKVVGLVMTEVKALVTRDVVGINF
jgi:hypothetical protein